MWQFQKPILFLYSLLIRDLGDICTYFGTVMSLVFDKVKLCSVKVWNLRLSRARQVKCAPDSSLLYLQIMYKSNARILTIRNMMTLQLLDVTPNKFIT
jgi:hypothetical protein